MPVVRCPKCDALVAHLGKTLSFKCPAKHRGRTPRPIHVDKDLVRVSELNGDSLDGVHTGAKRRERAREAAARMEARYGI